MAAKIHEGWIVVPYDGHDLSQVYLSIDDEWSPAFLDWVDGDRVAKVRTRETYRRHANVKIKIDDVVTSVGRLA